MTPKQLSIATGARIDKAEEWLPAIESAMAEFEINTPERQAAFLAQLAESSANQARVDLVGLATNGLPLNF